MSTSTGHTDFSGLWVPLITPFRGGRVDFPALGKLVGAMRDDGVAGLVACGSTGEAAALDKSEQRDVLGATVEAAKGLPVAMGLSGYHLPEMLRQVADFTAWPIAGLLVPPPHYIRPSQAGLLQWFRGIADASPVPLIVYDIPYRTGVTLECATLLELASHPRIRAVKDCGGDLAKTLALIADGRLQVLAGEDLQMFATLAYGGAGAITASAHVATRRFTHLLRLLANGELAQARRLWLTLVPLITAAFAEPNPAPVKTLLAQQGLIADELRAPMQPSSPAHGRRLAQVLRDLENAGGGGELSRL